MSDAVTAPAQPQEPTADSGARLGLGVIWAYTLSRVAFSIMGVMFAIYLMRYATDVLLIAPATMGLLLAAARLWDGVTDPLVGYLSDRTRSRFGRRKVWLYGSALPIAIGIVMLWSPPADLDGGGIAADHAGQIGAEPDQAVAGARGIGGALLGLAPQGDGDPLQPVAQGRGGRPRRQPAQFGQHILRCIGVRAAGRVGQLPERLKLLADLVDARQ
jgi:hypothetical protein